MSMLPPSDFVKLAPTKRLGSLRKWFLILIIIGLLSMLFVGYKLFLSKSESTDQLPLRSLSGFLIPTAYAQSEQPSPTQSVTDRRHSDRSTEIKQNIMVGIVVVLAVLLLVSFGAVLFGTEPNKVTLAGDILKTVLGFFIGVATTFFGA